MPFPSCCFFQVGRRAGQSVPSSKVMFKVRSSGGKLTGGLFSPELLQFLQNKFQAGVVCVPAMGMQGVT